MSGIVSRYGPPPTASDIAERVRHLRGTRRQQLPMSKDARRLLAVFENEVTFRIAKRELATNGK